MRSVRADIADQHGVAMDADAHAQRLGALGLPARVQHLHAALDAQRRHAGAPGMVLEQRRRAPEGHDAVAHELVDRAVLLVDRAGDQLEMARHAQQQRLRRDAPPTGVEKSSRSEKKMVRKRLWPPSCDLLRRSQQLLDQSDRHEGGERLHRRVERVDRARQHGDLADLASARPAAARRPGPGSSSTLAASRSSGAESTPDRK